MTPPGLHRDDRHRYFLGTDGPYPSVTTVLNVIAKPALINWAKRTTAEAAVDHLAELSSMSATTDRAGVVAFLSGIATKNRDDAAARGTAVHAIAEAIATGTIVPIPADLAPYLAAYQAFLADGTPTFRLVEAMVFNRAGYGGTLDAVATDPSGTTWMIDIKTSRGIYPDTALQLAGYAMSDGWGMPDDPELHPLPAIERFGILHLRPDASYVLQPVRVTRATFGAFYAAMELNRYQTTEGKEALADKPLIGAARTEGSTAA